MQKIIVFFLSLFLFSCSSDSDSSSSEPLQFEISLSTQNNQSEVFENVGIVITGNKEFGRFNIKEDNFANNTGVAFSPDLFSINGFLNFDSPGEKTVIVIAETEAGETAEASISFNIVRGDKLRIKSVKVVSFSGIGSTWDPEFDAPDLNRLADVSFGITMNHPDWFMLIDNPANVRNLFWSEVRYNQGDYQGGLVWDVLNEDIYIDPNLGFDLKLIDSDTGSYPDHENLLGLSDYLHIDWSSYVQSQPTIITLQDPSSYLEIEFEVEWPN